MKEMIGKKFGRLTVIGVVDNVENKKSLICKCDCGSEKTYNKSKLLCGSSKGCGCMRGKTQRHGYYGTPTYRSWYQMIDRCENKNHHAFNKYGGRGITVCDLWRKDFMNFFKDMGNRPEGTSIDRINNDDGYYPENCRWASNTLQQLNRNSKGCSKKKNKYEAAITINGKHKYIGVFNTEIDAHHAYEAVKASVINSILQNKTLDNFITQI